MKEVILGWVWSDELADSLRESPEIAPLIPPSWSARPLAFAADSNEDPLATGRRLLGIEEEPGDTAAAVEGPCSCGATAAT